MTFRPSALLVVLGLVVADAAAQGSLAETPVSVPGGPFRIGPVVRLDSDSHATASNELSLSLSPARPLHAVAAWNDYREGAPRVGVGISIDGGANWVDDLLRPPVAFQSGTEADPMTASDPRTGTLWVGGLSFGANGGVFVARKDPERTTLEPVVMAFTGGGVDKGLMAAGPDPAAPLTATRLYIAFNRGVIASADMGETWSPPTPLEMGLGFVPRVGPSGTLYVAYWDTLDRINLVRSLDGGATLEAPLQIAQRLDVWGLDGTRTPGDFRVPPFPTFAVDPISEDLYCAYPDTTAQTGGNYDVDLYLTRSEDRGLTWSVPEIIRGSTGTLGDQFFPWMEIDRAGRLHLVRYDTGFTPQDDLDPFAWMDAVYSFSRDTGQNWTDKRLTASSFTSADDGFGGIFVGDYLGLSTGGGRTLPAYMATSGGNADVFTHSIVHGAATTYCFGLSCPCGNEDPFAGCGNFGSDGDMTTGARLRFSGSDEAVRDDLELEMSGLAPGAFGLLLSSRVTVSPPFGDGRRCVGGQVYRYPVRHADAAGALRYGPFEVAALSSGFGAQGLVSPSSTWNYQGWYRDAAGPCGAGFNLTNGLSVTWR